MQTVAANVADSPDVSRHGLLRGNEAEIPGIYDALETGERSPQTLQAAREQSVVTPAQEASRTPGTKAFRQLLFAAILCFVFMIGEIVGGVISGSLAIIADVRDGRLAGQQSPQQYHGRICAWYFYRQ